MNWGVALPLLLLLVSVFVIGAWASKRLQRGEGFLSDYFLGSREFGGLLLAMTMVATYASASSFLGGPGAAYSIGFGWVLLAMTQVATGYFVLLVLGKKFAIVARRYNAITFIDFLKERYQSTAVVIIAAISIIVFLFSAMAAQWMGGAYLIQSVTGISYLPSLFIFTVAVLVYVIVGGFRAVVVTDAVQGIVMFVGTILLLIGVIIAGGGVSNLFAGLYDINPNLITPFGADGNLTAAYVSSYWILVGVGVVALPQIAVRAMSYRDSRSMHRAIMIGTVVVGVIMLCMHLIGVFAQPILPGIEVADQVIPLVAMEVLPPWLAGVLLAAPLAAIMSTVDSLLLLVSSSVVKDVYLNYIKPDASIERVKKISMGVTAIVGIIAFLLAISPPDLLVFLNLFAIGGLESAFMWPLIFGLYWKYANKKGAIASMVTGFGSYVAIHFYNQANDDLFGVHTVTVPVLVSLIIFVLVSLMFKEDAYYFPTKPLKRL